METDIFKTMREAQSKKRLTRERTSSTGRDRGSLLLLVVVVNPRESGTRRIGTLFVPGNYGWVRLEHPQIRLWLVVVLCAGFFLVCGLVVNEVRQEGGVFFFFLRRCEGLDIVFVEGYLVRDELGRFEVVLVVG